MTPEKVQEVIHLYRGQFERMGVEKFDHPHEAFLTLDESALSHCHSMLDKMEHFIEIGKMEKTFRWLGFIQGCLWSQGIFSLEDLKGHNMPS